MQLRILLVNSHLVPRGGDWTYVRTVEELLKRHGHEVILYGLAIPGSQSSLPFEELLPEIDFRAAFARRSVVDVFRVVSRTVYSPEANRSMAKILEKYKPDVVHLNNIHHFMTPGVVWPIVRHGIPVIWTLHDHTIICPNTTFVSHGQICEACSFGRFYPCLLKRCKRGSVGASFLAAAEAYVHFLSRSYKQVSRFIAPSLFLKQKFEQRGFPASRIVHLSNPAPLMARKAQGGAGVGGLFIGRLSEEKGVSTLLHALSKVPEVQFAIAGDGPSRPALEKYAREQSLHNVRFLGKLSTEEATKVLDECAFVVLPSQWYENCPYSAIEAMMCRKPVIASSIGGLSEIVEHDESGFLCPAGSSEALAEAISRLHHDPALCLRLGKRAAELARLLFDGDEYCRKLLYYYKEAIDAMSAH